MKFHYHLLLIIISLSIQTYSQNKKIELQKDDFKIDSKFYRFDLHKKLIIGAYLNESNRDTLNVRKMLLNKCFSIEESKNEVEKDSLNRIEKALNSLGSVVFCINEIDFNGNIHFNLSRSASLKLSLGEGIMKRY